MGNNRDLDLSIKIRDSLTHDDRLSAHTIDVSAVDGVVTLWGTVQTYRRKLAALEIAGSTPGCRDIIDKIDVVPEETMTDDEVAQNVRRALDAHADITKEVITVTVTAGNATLRGNVSSTWERDLAEDVALAARGVRSVQNLILVDLDRKIEDEALTLNIQHALSQTGELSGLDVRVAVTGDTAVLSGEVPSFWQKKRAGEIVNRFRVAEVRNDIIVTGD